MAASPESSLPLDLSYSGFQTSEEQEPSVQAVYSGSLDSRKVAPGTETTHGVHQNRGAAAILSSGVFSFCIRMDMAALKTGEKRQRGHWRLRCHVAETEVEKAHPGLIYTNTSVIC